MRLEANDSSVTVGARSGSVATLWHKVVVANLVVIDGRNVSHTTGHGMIQCKGPTIVREGRVTPTPTIPYTYHCKKKKGCFESIWC